LLGALGGIDFLISVLFPMTATLTLTLYRGVVGLADGGFAYLELKF
jgi:hypothetical protein